MKLTERVLANLKERRDRVLNGDINSIPSPFKRFSNDFIGIEQSKYYIVTSTTKTGKSMFSSYLFLYNTLLYAYNHPEKIRLKVFYYPLEETPEQVLLRFISFLLYHLSGHTIIKSPVDLNSTKNIAIDEDILDLVNSEEYKKILDFFEETVVFSDSVNCSGVWFECQRYAKEHGTIYREKYTYKNELGEDVEAERFSHYEPSDPNEYRLIFYDHVSLCQPERGMDQRQTMTKLSEYFVLLRNRYKFTIVAIQQQMMNSDGLDAFKAGKLRPSINTTGDAKTLSRDCDCCIGLFSPYRHELPNYLGYDVTRLKDNLRFAEILINRSGQSNGIVALMFLGQCNYWAELPLPKDSVGTNKVYAYLDSINNPKQNKVFLLYSNFIKKSLERIKQKYLTKD